MASDFFFPFGWLNFLLLSEKKRKKIIDKIRLLVMEVIKLFEYWYTNKNYLNWLSLYKQMINKVLPIIKKLYLSYLLIFLFNNATSHSIYI